MARLTSGSVCEPVMMVNVPRAFNTGRTPMERYSLAPYSSGAAAARRTFPNIASAAAAAPPRRNSSRRFTPAGGLPALSLDRLGIVPPYRTTDTNRDYTPMQVAFDGEMKDNRVRSLENGHSGQ